jgi:response regulator RpfG family c-di-GMP phosphodiesterase
MGEYTVMFVDDEPYVLESMQRMFHTSPYKVLLAESGEEALELMGRERVDILITDQRMPKMTGIELCHAVKGMYPSTIRIILSGYTDINDLIKAINQGEVYRFLRKPMDMAHMDKIVERAIEQNKVIRAFQHMLEAVNKTGSSYAYQVDYTKGHIKVALSGETHILTQEQVTCLMQCLVKWPEEDIDLPVLSTVLARQNGKMTINVEFGGGLNLVVEMPIEDELMDDGGADS